MKKLVKVKKHIKAVIKNFPKHIYGVDFSGAVDAGKKIWISSGTIKEGVLYINKCYQASKLPRSGNDRDRSLLALCDFIRNAGVSAFGMDFPFGLPEELVEKDNWEGFVLSFKDLFSSPQSFRETCRSKTGGLEIKRITDIESKAPFSPYNLRMYRQTYFGIANIIYPLILNNRVCVLPMQKPKHDKPWLLEICPASILKSKDLYFPYKGRTKECYNARSHIIKEIIKGTAVQIDSKGVQPTILNDPHGDALDSILAAVATYRAICNPDRLMINHNNIEYNIEGYVYV